MNIQAFFSGSWWSILGRWLLVIVIAVFFYVAFSYARKRNLSWLIYIEFALLIFAAVGSFMQIPNFIIYCYFLIAALFFTNLLFFVQDFRRDLFRRTLNKHVKDMNYQGDMGREELSETVDAIVRACQHLSKSDIGALILVADNIQESILDSGTTVNSEVTADLLETIFFPKTPLHDGAVVIMANRVVAAGCYLPLTQNLNLPREYGTRHRAAIGITDMNPSITAIVVSEETGIISAMHDGKVQRYLDAESLRKILNVAVHLDDNSQEETLWGGRE